MKISRGYKLLLAVVITALLVPGALSCTPSGKELAMAFVEEWMNEHDINPGTTGGKFNIGLRLLRGTTGNKESDAALETVAMLTNFVAAEKQMDLGRKTDNAAAMDAAIKMRPQDWSYQQSRATLAMKQGDVNLSIHYSTGARHLAEKDANGSAVRRYYTQTITEDEGLVNGGKFATYTTQVQSQIYYDLAVAYTARSKLPFSDANDTQRAIYYQGKYEQFNLKNK